MQEFKRVLILHQEYKGEVMSKVDPKPGYLQEKD